jgi:3-isopropylmalate/(R)-2-methylmalate dehydratase small subunit
MEKVMKGKAWKFGNNIDTDQIYPGIYVELTEMEDIKKHALSGSAEPKFADEVQPGDIVVAGTNFGCGSSREHAAMTLKGAGVGAVLAESFGRIFFRNAINLGLPVIVCPGISKCSQKGDEIRIDIETGEVTDVTRGKVLKTTPFSPYVLNILESGGIKNMIRKSLMGKA